MTMNPEYFAIRFDMGDHDKEVWQALLSEWPFESFHEEEKTITGYIQRHDILEDMMHFIDEHKGVHFMDYDLSQVEDKNWNAVWESSFNPVAVDKYCYIRAEFHEQGEKEYKHIVTISPKMAFGTGHHATTFMMLQAMEKLDFVNKRVLDFGCGTGILAIVAAMEGAATVIGVDIQPEAVENSFEHAIINGVEPQCHFELGGLDKAGTEPYDIVLANINRNVILDHLAGLKSLLNPDGHILFSGIMFDDVEIVKTTLIKLGFQITEHHEKDQWAQLTVRA